MRQEGAADSLGSPSELGLHNRRRIVAAVRRNGALARVDLARLTGLSKGAVSTIVAQLIKDGLLTEEADEANGTPRAARRSLRLTLNPAYATAIGVELTDARAEAIALDPRGVVHAVATRPFASDAPPATILAAVSEAVRAVLGPASAWGPVRGVGVAVPGLVDAARGVSLWIPGLLHWQEVPIVAELERSLGLPVFFDWRAYTATLAEQWYGAGRGEDDFLYINVGDGVGMGIVLGGRLLRGATSMAGMLAHLRVDDSGDGPTCVCGNVGCLQTRVAVPALIHRAQRAVADGVLTVLTAPVQTEPGAVSLDALVAAARNGDKMALNLLEDAGVTLGRAVADLIHLFNPPLIIIGGQISRAGDLLLEPVQRAARRLTLPHMYGAVRLVLSALRPGAAVLGAGTMVLQHVFDHDVEALPGADESLVSPDEALAGSD